MFLIFLSRFSYAIFFVSIIQFYSCVLFKSFVEMEGRKKCLIEFKLSFNRCFFYIESFFLYDFEQNGYVDGNAFFAT